jgi:hypothetical protein
VAARVYTLRNDDGEIQFSRRFALLDPDERPGAKVGDYELKEEFSVTWTVWEGNTRRSYRIRVPKGVRTDIASVPRLVWTLSGLTPDGLYRNAALIHDIIYMWCGEFPPRLVPEAGRGWRLG